jgi:hypothetical protein
VVNGITNLNAGGGIVDHDSHIPCIVSSGRRRSLRRNINVRRIGQTTHCSPVCWRLLVGTLFPYSYHIFLDQIPRGSHLSRAVIHRSFQYHSPDFEWSNVIHVAIRWKRWSGRMHGYTLHDYSSYVIVFLRLVPPAVPTVLCHTISPYVI